MYVYELCYCWEPDSKLKMLNDGWEPFAVSGNTTHFRKPAIKNAGQTIVRYKSPSRETVYKLITIPGQVDDENLNSQLHNDPTYSEFTIYAEEKARLAKEYHDFLEEARTKAALEYDHRSDEDVDDMTTDLWGGAGPDCRTMPFGAG